MLMPAPRARTPAREAAVSAQRLRRAPRLSAVRLARGVATWRRLSTVGGNMQRLVGLLVGLMAAARGALLHAPAFRPRASISMASYAIGVDVGTGSARAGVVDVASGALVGVHKRDIRMWNPKEEHYEQSSEDIWESVCVATRGALEAARVDASDVVGIAFDATCSLVCLDGANAPVGVDPTAPAEDERNIIVWLDHRAVAQASAINLGAHERLATVGGVISPEMEVPKMLWLKEAMPAAFSRVDGDGGKFLDLADYLAYRATDYSKDVRSLCTVVCKWNYDAKVGGGGKGWDRNYFGSIGFGPKELAEGVIGNDVRTPGAPIEGGIGPHAAAALGLVPGTALGVGMIDAHAGGVGSLCAGERSPSEARMMTTL